MVVQASEDGKIAMYSVEGDHVRGINGHSRAVVSLARHPKESRIASGSADGWIKIWDIPSKK